ncbi:nucleoside/nucleotide kinase family protein [Auraticoccus monumenti]|uniref:AAA domain-containing protein n=1 Tax=Auraticoccus monumenti TaxID=675864 RepID=A0A1G6YT44_9ACTN|nr:hypothetical protein [Auraticoccus monumenti]SDD92805.1 hypothetical protein SAMN04489747_2075 [Auraticoccus monumenti]
MRPLILSGGPAAGKSTCGRTLALERARAAFIDADDVRQLVVAGDATLWSGPEGSAQLLLSAHNVSALGRSFTRAGFDVVIADFLTPASLEVYRDEFPRAFAVHLRISLQEARARAATRTVYLTEDEFDLLHGLTDTPPDVDEVLDVDDLTTTQQLAALREIWIRASGAAKPEG